MDKLYTTGESAAELGTTIPRVLRAARKGHVPSVSRGNRTLLPESSVELLRRRWGWTPAHHELTRHELLVLAALSRCSRGSRSARRIAARAGVSPTTAVATLQRLAEREFVERSTVTEVAGDVREVQVWQVRWSAAPWQRVASQVGGVSLPARTETRAHDVRVPSRLAHRFWNTDMRELIVEDHAVLIAGRILGSNDPEALAWMVRNVPSEAIERATRRRGMDPRSAALGRVLALST